MTPSSQSINLGSRWTSHIPKTIWTFRWERWGCSTAHSSSPAAPEPIRKSLPSASQLSAYSTAAHEGELVHWGEELCMCLSLLWLPCRLLHLPEKHNDMGSAFFKLRKDVLTGLLQCLLPTMFIVLPFLLWTFTSSSKKKQNKTNQPRLTKTAVQLYLQFSVSPTAHSKPL